MKRNGTFAPDEDASMPLSPQEAVKRINESVTVEMLVQRTKCCSGSRQVFLDSEANHRDPKNLGVVVTESGRAKFSELGIYDPTAHFNGKTIRVQGVVTLKESRPQIEVDDPAQIEVVSFS
jgi:DNA/RNA endonuclease YhcR with UshA esterase domain